MKNIILGFFGLMALLAIIPLAFIFWSAPIAGTPIIVWLGLLSMVKDK